MSSETRSSPSVAVVDLFVENYEKAGGQPFREFSVDERSRLDYATAAACRTLGL